MSGSGRRGGEAGRKRYKQGASIGAMGIFFRDSKKVGRNGRINVSSGGIGGSYKLGPARITQKANGQQTVRIRTGLPGLNFTKTFGKKRR